jgi:hypothetical protein
LYLWRSSAWRHSLPFQGDWPRQRAHREVQHPRPMKESDDEGKKVKGRIIPTELTWERARCSGRRRGSTWWILDWWDEKGRDEGLFVAVLRIDRSMCLSWSCQVLSYGKGNSALGLKDERRDSREWKIFIFIFILEEPSVFSLSDYRLVSQASSVNGRTVFSALACLPGGFPLINHVAALYPLQRRKESSKLEIEYHLATTVRRRIMHQKHSSPGLLLSSAELSWSVR